jgi:hypothetical protein
MSIPNCRRLNAFTVDTETIILLSATFGISENMTGVTGSFESTGGSKYHSHTLAHRITEFYRITRSFFFIAIE